MAVMAEMIIGYLHCAERLFARRGSPEAAFRWPGERPGVPSPAARRLRGSTHRGHAISSYGQQYRHDDHRNRAAASAYLLVLISKDGDHRCLPPGRYACELIREDSGQWRFSRRIVFHDHDYTLDADRSLNSRGKRRTISAASGPASKVF